MKEAMRCAFSGGTLRTVQLGTCRRSVHLNIVPWMRTLSTVAAPPHSLHLSTFQAIPTTKLRVFQGRFPCAQILRTHFQEAASRSLSSSPLSSATSKNRHQDELAASQENQPVPPSRPFPHRPAPYQSTVQQWKVNYEQSSLHNRAQAFREGRFPDQRLLWLIIGINVAVFGLWQYAENAVKRFKDPRPMFNMYYHFTCSLPNLEAGRFWTILTSCFSHRDVNHFLINMVSLFFMAPAVLTLLGPRGFSLLYIGSGIGASIFSLSWKNYINPWINRNNWDEQRQKYEKLIGAQGASGSIFGVITTFALINPRQTFLLFFVLPAPAWLIVPGFFAWDLYSAWERPNSGTDSPAHLGGALCGLLFWRFRLRKFQL